MNSTPVDTALSWWWRWMWSRPSSPMRSILHGHYARAARALERADYERMLAAQTAVRRARHLGQSSPAEHWLVQMADGRRLAVTITQLAPGVAEWEGRSALGVFSVALDTSGVPLLVAQDKAEDRFGIPVASVTRAKVVAS